MKTKRLAINSLAAVLAVVSALLTACITDEGIPYPNIQANFTQFVVANQQRSSQIDSVNRVVTVFLNDSADIASVEVKKVAFNRPDAGLVDPSALDAPLNLTDTVKVALKVYREYVWSIVARQSVSRYFTVENQIGESRIDVDTRTVTATVPSDLPLTHIKVLSIKLAGATAVMTPDIDGRVVDFSSPVKVDVLEFGETQTWTIEIEQTDLNVSIASIDAWTNVAWVSANAKAGDTVEFEYRKLGTMAWTALPQANVTPNGAVFTALLNHLDAETTYEVRAHSGEETTIAQEFTTGEAVQLPNSDLTNWWLDNKVWCPWTKDGAQFWDTGNKGASTLGESNVIPIENIDSPTGYQGALLQTKFIGISVIGKLGAGSIFTGVYVRTDGTNGVLSFGRPFVQRPTKLRATLKYKNVPIDYVSSDFPDYKGRPDTCSVWIALSDREETYEIRTNPKNRQLFNPADPSIVAYGQFNSGDPIEPYTTIEIPLDYRATNRVPKQIIVVAAASKYGDFFTGGAGSVLSLKSVELLYDLE